MLATPLLVFACILRCTLGYYFETDPGPIAMVITRGGGGYSLCKAIRGCAALVGHFFEKIP